MDPCTDPRHRQTWKHMPKPRKRALSPTIPALTLALLVIFLGLVAVKAFANAAHDAVRAETFMEGY